VLGKEVVLGLGGTGHLDLSLLIGLQGFGNLNYFGIRQGQEISITIWRGNLAMDKRQFANLVNLLFALVILICVLALGYENAVCRRKWQETNKQLKELQKEKAGFRKTEKHNK